MFGNVKVVDEYAFYEMFYNSGLVSVPQLFGSIQSVENYAFYKLFYYCDKLETVADNFFGNIPADVQTKYSMFSQMFYYCYSLSSVGLLGTFDFTFDEYNIFDSMFGYCSNVVEEQNRPQSPEIIRGGVTMKLYELPQEAEYSNYCFYDSNFADQDEIPENWK
jgi:hypothetical protein